MSARALALELLLMIADEMRDANGELLYDDYNSFLQVNRTLYHSLNNNLWQEAAQHLVSTQRVLSHLIETNNPTTLEIFLGLGAEVETPLPAFDLTHLGVDVPDQARWVHEAPLPLIIVAGLDNVPLARVLLEKGAKVQYYGQQGQGKFSPLHVARSRPMVNLLLDYKADPNHEDQSRRWPLHWYARRDDIDTMLAILERGARVNAPTPFPSPLHEAAKRNLDTVEFLVAWGADMTGMSFQYATPLHWAAEAGNVDVVEYFLRWWPRGARARGDDTMRTPLHRAAFRAAYSCERNETVALLVEHWPEAIVEKDELGDTPLHSLLYGMTLFRRRVSDAAIEVVRLLVGRRPEVKESLNNLGLRPLDMLAEGGPLRVRPLRLREDKKRELLALLQSA